MHIIAFDPSCSSAVTLLFNKIAERDGWQPLLPILSLLNSATTVQSHVLEPIISLLQKRGEEVADLKDITEILEKLHFGKESIPDNFPHIIEDLLNAERPVGTDGCAPANAAQSARRRASQPPFSRDTRRSRNELLAIAERLRAAPPPHRPNRHPGFAWPSGPMSFDEFLLQWPCEVDLPIDLDDQAFIEEAYQAILLRGPDIGELHQYLRLLQNHAASKPWIIEDLLASNELPALER